MSGPETVSAVSDVLPETAAAAAGAAGSAVEAVLLFIWLILLAVWDIRKRELPFYLLAAGGTAGILLRIADFASGTAPADLAGIYLPGLLAAALLLAAARLTREAVGYGDGICFCILAFWLPWEELFTLLFTALVLCALPGLLIGLVRGRRVKALPFMPFVAGAYLVLRLAALAGSSGAASP